MITDLRRYVLAGLLLILSLVGASQTYRLRNFSPASNQKVPEEIVDIALNSRGHLLVIDKKTKSVMIYDSLGIFKESFNSVATQNGTLQLKSPKHIYVDAKDGIYIWDEGLGKVITKQINGKGIAFGERGSDLGQVNDVRDIAVDNEGYVYVVNGSRDQIDIFAKDGSYITWVKGSEGTFQRPESIGINGRNELYVLDKEGPKVLMYDITGMFFNAHRTFNRNAGSPLTDTGGMAVMQNGDFFIWDEETQSISQFDKMGNLAGKLGTKGKTGAGTFSEMAMVAVSQSEPLYMAIYDKSSQFVQVFQVNDARPILYNADERLKYSSVSSKMPVIHDIAVGPNGYRYTVSADQKMIVAYGDTTNNEVFSIRNKFKQAGAIATDKSGNIYVIDEDEKEVIKFDVTGTIQAKFGKDIKDRLREPSGIVIQSSGVIVVCDYSNGNIHAWTPAGSYQRIITSPQQSTLRHPKTMHVDSKDQLYVWDEDQNAIFRIAASGWPVSLKKIQVRSEDGSNKPGEIGGFFVDPLNQIHVFNKTTSQIEVYSWELEPKLLHTFGSRADGSTTLSKTDKLLFDPLSFIVYAPFDDNRGQRAFRFRFKPKTPENNFDFDADDKGLKVYYTPVPATTITQYALYETLPNGTDSLIQVTNESHFILPQEGDEMRLHHYKVASVSHGNYSDPNDGFDNAIAHAERLIKASRFDEASMLYDQILQGSTGGPDLKMRITNSLVSASAQLKGREEVVKSLQFAKYAYTITPNDNKTKTGLASAYVGYFKSMAERGDYKDIIDEAERLLTTSAMKPIVLSAIDSVGVMISSVPSESSINNAIALQKRLISWDPINAGFNASLANSYFELYKFNRVSGVPVFELEAALKEAERYAAQSVSGLKKNGQPYYETQLVHLSVLNAAGRYSETEGIAFNELNASGPMMSNRQLIQYRIRLAESYAGQGKDDLAILEYDRVKGLDPQIKGIDLPMAQSLFKVRRMDQAREIYQKLLIQDRDNAKYIAAIGEIELAKGNFAEASFQLEKAAKKDPADRSFYGPLAEAFQGASNYQRAIDSYEVAIQFEETKLLQARNGFAPASEVSQIKAQLERYLLNDAGLNHQVGDYEKAISLYNKVISTNPTSHQAYFGLGKSCMAASHVYDAVSAYSKALQYDPANSSYSQAKDAAIKERDRREKEQPALEIQNIYVKEVFPSLYRNYSDVRLLKLGEVVVTNNTSQTITPTSIRVFVKNIMDQPTELKPLPMVPYSDNYVNLAAVFNSKILDFSGDESIQLELTLEYAGVAGVKSVTKSQAFIIHGRNAVTWTDKRCMGAFVAPGVDVLIDYNKKADHIFRDQITYGLNKNMLKAMQLYVALRNSQMIYSADPTLNYTIVSTNTDILDYLQYPAETMKRKSGDCDDLVVLMASLLENAGVPTAYIDVPGHVFLAFDSQLKPGQIASAGLNELDVVISEDKVWIPLEMTLVGTHGFLVAWKTGAERYYKELTAGHFPELVPLQEARNVYVPSNYVPAGFEMSPPDNKEVVQDYGASVLQLLAKTKREVIAEMETRYLTEPENVYVKNKYGSLLAQIGDLAKAERVFLEALELSPSNPVTLNNLGNLYYLQGNARKAIENYEKASNLDTFDGEIRINLCKAYLLSGDRQQARSWFDSAVAIDSELEKLYSNLKTQVK